MVLFEQSPLRVELLTYLYTLDYVLCHYNFVLAQVNGELAGFFTISRGLRQGCSLSSYLFVICIDVLSNMLDRAVEERYFGYHPRCKTLGLTHSSFADDLMVLSDGKLRSVEGIIAVFDEFAKCSGLKISLEILTLYLTGNSPTSV